MLFHDGLDIYIVFDMSMMVPFQYINSTIVVQHTKWISLIVLSILQMTTVWSSIQYLMCTIVFWSLLETSLERVSVQCTG